MQGLGLASSPVALVLAPEAESVGAEQFLVSAHRAFAGLAALAVKVLSLVLAPLLSFGVVHAVTLYDAV